MSQFIGSAGPKWRLRATPFATLSGPLEKVETDVKAASERPDYKNPTETLPEPPPPICHDVPLNGCSACDELSSWWSRFRSTIDDILFKSNIHKCSSNKNKDGSQNKARPYKGCLDNIWNQCKARFPRPTYAKTEVDAESGSINMKKGEPWLNMFTYAVTYVLRCNTDITSLHSGTAIKGVLLYVSNYVTKPALKTHVIFDTVRSMFQKQIINSLSAKMEMGSPMACMYLLGNLDHYTNYSFIPFYWKSFVQEARKPWDARQNTPLTDRAHDNSSPECKKAIEDHDLQIEQHEKVAIFKRNGCVIGLSPVHDYVFWPAEFHSMCLYDWISRHQRKKKGATKNKKGAKQDNAALNAQIDCSSSVAYSDNECPDMQLPVGNLQPKVKIRTSYIHE